jgi:dimethylargininase
MFTYAITRRPGPDMGQGLTTSDLGAPDFELMCAQHEAYVEALESLDLAVIVLRPLPGYPDAYFVEDAAIVTPEVAVITRPGALPRRGEEAAMAPVLAHCKPTEQIVAPGTLEGGDVLLAGKRVFVGLSRRSNREGLRQLQVILEPFGYQVNGVPVPAGLHLKSGVSYVAEGTLLVTPEWTDCPAWNGWQRLVVPQAEAYAANSLLINEHLLTPAGYPATRRLLAGLGYPLIELDTSEARKMDGGLSCMSLRF